MKITFLGTSAANAFPEAFCSDVVILDHTYDPDQPGRDHLSARQFIDQVNRMRNDGLLQPGARTFATHIAHAGNPAHPALVEFAMENGYEVAYDGLVLEV